MFFEAFREALARYAAGVHETSAPASEAALAAAAARLGRPLPSELADLYRSWNGLRLFCDSFFVAPAETISSEGDRMRLGEALGAPLLLDGEGRLFEADEAGDSILVGSSLERWLAALMAREGLLVDREGEWKDVFEGDGLKVEVRQKRARAGLKADPAAAAWHEEAAELAFEAGQVREAVAALARAVELDPGAAAAWELLGGLERQQGRPAEAARAFRSAARATADRERRRERLAEAARAAEEAGDEAGRAEAAAAGLADGDAFTSEWLAEALARESEGDVDGALNRARLLCALAPGGEADALARRLRARVKLRPIE